MLFVIVHIVCSEIVGGVDARNLKQLSSLIVDVAVGILVFVRTLLRIAYHNIFHSDVVALDIRHAHLHEAEHFLVIISCPVALSLYDISVGLPDSSILA